jgi:peroxiredoxin
MNSYRINRKIVASILIVFAGAAWIWASRDIAYAQYSREIAAPQEGFSAPDFSLPSSVGPEISLSDYKGNPVILNFWASWCPPCRREMPAFNQVYNEFRDQGLIIMAVNATNQDSIHAASQFAEENQLDFLILFDRSGSVGSLYNLNSLPTTFFIDKSGTIHKKIIGGPLPSALLRVEIADLLENNE